MFGEKFITSQGQITVGLKWVIVLPKFTYVEMNDELQFAKVKENACFTIFSKNQIFKKLSILVSKQENAKDDEEYEFIQQQIDKLQNYCFGVQTADSQHQVIIPKTLRDNLTIGQKIYAEGGIALQIPCLHVYSDKQMIKRT